MKCPGQDSRNWGPEAIFEAQCPQCGGAVEFFKDEGSRKCRKCGHKVLNPRMDFGCAAYCRFASQCLGEELPPELAAKRIDLLKDRIAMEVKKVLGRDFKLIGRLVKVIEYTGRVIRVGKTNPAAVLIAARLAVLIPEPRNAESATSVTAQDTSCQREITGNEGIRCSEENSGPLATAASILDKTGAPHELAVEVIALLREIKQGKTDSDGARFISDALRLATMGEHRA